MGVIVKRPPTKEQEQDARIAALEARLDALVSMLADEMTDEEGEPVTDLDGNPAYRDRDENQPL